MAVKKRWSMYIFIVLGMLVMFTGCFGGSGDKGGEEVKVENEYSVILDKIVKDVELYSNGEKRADEATFIGEGIYINVLAEDKLAGYEGWYYYSLEAMTKLEIEKINELLLLLAVCGPKERVYCVFGDKAIGIFNYKSIEDTKTNGEEAPIGGGDKVNKIDNIGITSTSAISTGTITNTKAYVIDYPILTTGGIVIKYEREIPVNSVVEFVNGTELISSTAISVIETGTAKVDVDLYKGEYRIKSKNIYFGKYGKLNIMYNQIESVSIYSPKYTAILSDKIKLKANIYPGFVENDTLIWSSSDNLKATVTVDGEVEFIALGRVEIKVETINKKTDIIVFEILENKEPVIEITETIIEKNISIKGTVYDNEDNLKKIIIYWGDGVEEVIEIDSIYYIDKTYTYNQYKNYQLKIIAEDNMGLKKEISKNIELLNLDKPEIIISDAKINKNDTTKLIVSAKNIENKIGAIDMILSYDPKHITLKDETIILKGMLENSMKIIGIPEYGKIRISIAGLDENCVINGEMFEIEARVNELEGITFINLDSVEIIDENINKIENIIKSNSLIIIE